MGNGYEHVLLVLVLLLLVALPPPLLWRQGHQGLHSSAQVPATMQHCDTRTPVFHAGLSVVQADGVIV